MLELLGTAVLVAHILAVMIAVGAVTLTDYIHVLGLRSETFEKQSLFLFPILSKLIISCLVIIYATGFLLVLNAPHLLQSSLFWLKLIMVLIVTVNGYILHAKLWPQVRESITTQIYPPKLMKQAAFAGSISIVSWFAIVVLATTKTLGYSVLLFAFLYVLAIAVAYLTAMYLESHKKQWQTP